MTPTAAGTGFGLEETVDLAAGPETARDRRARRLRRLNVRHVPGLRLVGITLLVGTVALHNALIDGVVDWVPWLVFALAALAYALGSWAALDRWYQPDQRPDLSVVFLVADLLPMAVAVYLTGAERSWIFWVFLLRVADQTSTRFRRALAFSVLGGVAYLGVVAYVAVVEGRAVTWPAELAKLLFLLLAGLYISLGARLAERIRDRLAEALRLARQSAAELTAQSRYLERARAEAEAGSRAKSAFLSRVSHVLRTPMNAILGFGQLLELENLSEDQRSHVQEILESGRHLLDVINEVLDIAHVETGALTHDLEPVHLGRALEDVLEGSAHAAAMARVNIPAVAPPTADVWVLATGRKLRQVFVNLVSNAIKYNQGNGRVEISCTVSNDRVRVAVTDTGPGLKAEVIEEAFVPFSPLAADEGGGTGLGLATARSLVKAMGGSIGVDTEPGEGSTFWVELIVTEPGPDSGAEASRPVGAARSGPLVLYIEDRPENVSLVRRILGRRPRIELISAATGLTGLAAARSHRPDLILLDLELPDIAGAEVLARLREDLTLREIPVVVVSAEAAPERVERLLAGGARAYFTMPYDVVEFLDVVDEALGRA